MEDDNQSRHEEIHDLKEELEKFKEEKERVRMIVGKIGGIPAFHTKLINIAFTASIVIFLAISIIYPKHHLIMIELTVVALSIKIVFLIHLQSKVSHFQLWVLSAIEWRMNEMMKIVKKIQKEK